MKKTIAILFIALAALSFVGCSGALHNTPISYVTYTFKNFSSIADGTKLYAVGGTMNTSWGDGFNDSHIVTFTGGTATLTTAQAIIQSGFSFTLTTNQWGRPWLNVDTVGNESGPPAGSNFHVTVPMDGGTHDIVVDASTNPATLTVN